jgi:type I restriction enzyme R subunit
MIDAMGENDELVTKYMTDSKFQATAFPVMAKIIYDMIRSRDTGS